MKKLNFVTSNQDLQVITLRGYTVDLACGQFPVSSEFSKMFYQ